ncbi:sentrin-specific protease 8 [Drosophila subobscura]|uniref:sentrin-specific protease 8 n=1 Tax=Drosophila subobscura TaxID=7241 RepID=UPI00155A5E07|nr:sentrin-specific protease 8 [Drosophila subobscura]
MRSTAKRQTTAAATAKKQPQQMGSSTSKELMKTQPSTMGITLASKVKGQHTPVAAARSSEVGAGDGLAKSGKDRLVTLRFQDISLLHADVKLLQERSCGMNERLVAFYFAYLQHRRYKRQSQVYFMQPSLVQSLRRQSQRALKRELCQRGLHETRFILLPLCSAPGSFNLDHEHWSLLLISRPERRLYYYDSMDNSHKQLAGALQQCLCVPLALTGFSLVVGRCLQQAHDEQHQSGIHLMCMADHVADYVLRCGYASSSLLIARDYVQGMRTVVLQQIQCMGGMLPNQKRSSSEA